MEKLELWIAQMGGIFNELTRIEEEVDDAVWNTPNPSGVLKQVVNSLTECRTCVKVCLEELRALPTTGGGPSPAAES